MSALILQPVRSGLRFGGAAIKPRNETTPRFATDDLCGGEPVIDFALCLIVAASIANLLLLAL